ncbi:MAG: hypothetical protein FWC67_00855 [Defluviitaleaceae bacterium]|nr:hypothetical protein [Defluviitaleaceae bacterium]
MKSKIVKLAFACLVATLVFSFGAAASARTNERVYFPGISIEYLRSLNDEQIWELHAPFREILDRVNATYGVDMSFPCISEIREEVFNTIYNMSFKEFEEIKRADARFVLEIMASNTIREAIIDNIYRFPVEEIVTMFESVNSLSSYEIIEFANMLGENVDVLELYEKFVDISPNTVGQVTRSRFLSAVNAGVRITVQTSEVNWATLGHAPPPGGWLFNAPFSIRGESNVNGFVFNQYSSHHTFFSPPPARVMNAVVIGSLRNASSGAYAARNTAFTHAFDATQ